MLKNRIICLTLAISATAFTQLYAQSSSTQTPSIPDWPSSGQSDPCKVPIPGQKPACPPAQQDSTTQPNATGSSSSSSQGTRPVSSRVETTVDAKGRTTNQTPEVLRTNMRLHPFRQYAVGVKFSPLGIGVEAATPLANHFNLRMGANFLNYNGTFDDSGWNYGAKLDFRSGQVQLDYFPFQHFGGFHVSPGFLIHKNHGSADIWVNGGQSFEMGDGTYTSSATDPVKGNATFTYDRSVAPMVSIGFGNLLPRNGRRWSIPFEIGGVFTGAPKFGLNLDGSVCEGPYCGKISAIPDAQRDLALQRVKVQNNLNDYAKVYPVVSVGFAWNFGPRN